MELSGKVIAVLEPRGGVSKTGNAWKVQEYVIETHDQYPRKMCFDVFGEDKINQFNIQVGEELTVHFDIDAREWQGRWFNSIRAWKVERAAAQPAPAGTDVPFPPMSAAPVDFSAGDEKDELPFRFKQIKKRFRMETSFFMSYEFMLIRNSSLFRVLSI